MGTFDIEYLVELDNQRFSHFKMDTRNTEGPRLLASTIFWYHRPAMNLISQEQLLVTVGQFHKLSDLKFKTNLPELLTFNSTSEENTWMVEINGKEVLVIEWCDDSCTSGMSPVLVRMTLSSGTTSIMELSLPRSQRPKNPVSASALLTGKFLRVRKIFARMI